MFLRNVPSMLFGCIDVSAPSCFASIFIAVQSTGRTACCRQHMEQLLMGGTHLVVDRYAYSGVAYSAAKGLNRDWCASVDEGLLAPDAVFFLKVDPEAAGNR